jgi:hypothetical protein
MSSKIIQKVGARLDWAILVNKIAIFMA